MLPHGIAHMIDPGWDPQQRVAIRCGRCGHAATNQGDRQRGEEIAYYCDDCQRLLIDQPVMPRGYRFVRQLGGGGMGTVYLVEHHVFGRRALKQLLPKEAMSKLKRVVFEREAREQARVDHPRVVKVHEFHETAPGIFCIVMDYVEGRSAFDLLAAHPNGLAPRVAVDIAIQALAGLAAVHAAGLVHRDVKDSNLLVASGEPLSVKLADFGLAKCYATAGISGITDSGTHSGTNEYMSPEQFISFRDVKPAGDIYSMGVTLYHLLTGAFPFDASGDTGVLCAILEGTIVPLRARRPMLPASLETVVMRALHREPEARYADANEMRRALSATIGAL
jgi:serine/threonine-protein kinase